jgi:hypothetical protein
MWMWKSRSGLGLGKVSRVLPGWALMDVFAEKEKKTEATIIAVALAGCLRGKFYRAMRKEAMTLKPGRPI